VENPLFEIQKHLPTEGGFVIGFLMTPARRKVVLRRKKGSQLTETLHDEDRHHTSSRLACSQSTSQVSITCTSSTEVLRRPGFSLHILHER